MNFSIQSLYTWYRSILRNPKYRWWAVLATAIYFVSPIDIVPDFLPIVGEIDDIFLLTLLVSEVSQIVIEGAKARKANADTKIPNTGNNSTTAKTVDVDSVSVH